VFSLVMTLSLGWRGPLVATRLTSRHGDIGLT